MPLKLVSIVQIWLRAMCWLSNIVDSLRDRFVLINYSLGLSCRGQKETSVLRSFWRKH